MTKRGPKGKGVSIRGVHYATQKGAARALGVTEAAISVAKARGTLDNVGCRANHDQQHSEKEANQ